MDLISCDCFRGSSVGTVFSKCFTSATCLMEPISCEFLSKIPFNYLEAKYWTYWTLFDKYFIPGPYLMDRISCDFF